MAFSLDKVVPWGRSFEEYRRMFLLTDDDLEGRILGCADGPASFNAEAARRGHNVVSCDPLYRLDAEDIRRRIEASANEILEQTAKNRREFVWKEFSSVEELGRARLRAMAAFLNDYEPGREQNRYIDAELPSLPFVDGQFSLAVCSHFLFLYSDRFGVDFHLSAIRELCRVAKEARIFPLLALGGSPSRHTARSSRTLVSDGFEVGIETVPYEFQRGGNRMMRVTKSR